MTTRPGFISSSVGTKVVLGLTGLAMLGFLIGHLAGNLLILVGPDVFNEYGHVLISNPLLVPAELGLLAILLLHVTKALQNQRANRAARPVAYALKVGAGHTSRKSAASSSMIVTGLIILGFLVVHIRTFKYGPLYLVEGSDVRNLHRLVVEVFQQPLWAGFYVVCMALVGMHLQHGISSAFQSLGVDGASLTPRLLALGKVLAIVIGGGFALIPVWIYFVGSPS